MACDYQRAATLSKLVVSCPTPWCMPELKLILMLCLIFFHLSIINNIRGRNSLVRVRVFPSEFRVSPEFLPRSLGTREPAAWGHSGLTRDSRWAGFYLAHSFSNSSKCLQVGSQEATYSYPERGTSTPKYLQIKLPPDNPGLLHVHLGLLPRPWR